MTALTVLPIVAVCAAAFALIIIAADQRADQRQPRDRRASDTWRAGMRSLYQIWERR